MDKTERLSGGTLLFTSDDYPATTDSLLLARFAAGAFNGGGLSAGASVCDLGSGGGVLLLGLVDAGLYGRAVGIELSEAGTALLRSAVSAGELINVESVQADFRTWKSPSQFDMVVSNPPYYDNGALPAQPSRAMARHQVNATLGEVCAAAARLLKDGGRLMLCYPPQRLAILFAELAAANLAPKAVQLVRAAPGAEPWLLLLEARKAAGPGLRFLPDLVPAKHNR